MPKVMLLEDDPTMLQLLTTLLKMEGFDVYAPTHWTAEELPSQIQREDPRLLLMDVRLKQADGLSLLKIIRHTPGISALKVILTSGQDIRDQSQSAGADGFLLKPFMPEELVHIIRTSIG